jgi:hypothetical protein
MNSLSYTINGSGCSNMMSKKINGEEKASGDEISIQARV